MVKTSAVDAPQIALRQAPHRASPGASIKMRRMTSVFIGTPPRRYQQSANASGLLRAGRVAPSAGSRYAFSAFFRALTMDRGQGGMATEC